MSVHQRSPRRRAAGVTIAAIALVLAACSSEAAPRAPSPSSTALTPTPATSAQYDQLIAAAKSEGTVVVSGPKGLPAFQKVLADDFTKEYGITVQYSGLGASKVLSSMQSTPATSPYPYDVLVGGYDTLMNNLAPEGALTDLDTQIVLPEDLDLSNWAGGHIPWDDSGHTTVGFLLQAGQYVYVDTTKVNPADITSYKDLLDPQYKGKILFTSDPRVDGTGNAVIAMFLQSKDLGTDFVTSLLTDQSPLIAQTDDDALADVKNPSFTICICDNSEGTELLADHPNFQKLDPHKIAEGTSTTSSFANMAMPSRVVHPNAAKLYVNWILSQATELAASQASGLPSTRTDVATNFLAAQSIPDPSWPPGSTEAAIEVKDQAAQLAVKLLGPLPPTPSS